MKGLFIFDFKEDWMHVAMALIMTKETRDPEIKRHQTDREDFTFIESNQQKGRSKVKNGNKFPQNSKENLIYNICSIDIIKSNVCKD